MKLHLGCGQRRLAGYHHIDVSWPVHLRGCESWTGERGDASHLSSIANESVDLLYACQLLEYWDREEITARVLPEWRRVLKPHGLLRLSVPNFAVLANFYSAGLNLDDWLLGTLYGRCVLDDGRIVYHRTTFDEKSLRKLLVEFGFCGVEHWDPWWELPETYDDFSKAELPRVQGRRGVTWNLNMQCRRPVLETN